MCVCVCVCVCVCGGGGGVRGLTERGWLGQEERVGFEFMYLLKTNLI